MSFSILATGSSQYVSMSIGNCGAMGSGAFTMVVLWQTLNDAGSFADRAAVTLQASSSTVRSILDVDRVLYAFNDFTSGYSSITSKTWYVAAVSKPAGAAHYRYHLWAYASNGSGTMSHGETTGAANQSDGSTATSILIGDDNDSTIHTNGLIAVVGLWASQLSDGQLDTLKSPNLSSWAALSPQALITGNNWNGSTGAADVAGTSTQQSITGTVGVGAEPPSFNYTLGGGSSSTPMAWIHA
ncbi:MAG TPA: hypothetical protein VLF59_05380 [Candidatus Saccharimonadales bacterium]|nr:hypothetical protein [Candidatus Saccharimonadales bacterium]